jgi:hypothetical protein
MHRARKLHEELGGDGLALGQSPLLLVKPKRKWHARWWRCVDRWKAADHMAQMALFRLG